MRKLFGILALTAIFGTAMAQEGGNFQVTAILGNNPMFNSFPLPKYGVGTTALYDQYGNEQTPEYYLRIDNGRSGVNTITNMAGVQLAYYLGPVDVNFMYAADFSLTPKKDFVPGYSSELYPDDDPAYDLYRQPDQKHIEGRLTSSTYLNVGGNFHVENKRANGYGGVRLGYKKSRLETLDPYTKALDDQLFRKNDTDDEVNDKEINKMLYNKSTKEGKIAAFQTAIVAGAECVSNCGFVFGVEFLPFSYQYSVIEIDPDGQYHYAVGHHNIKLFSNPTLKLGVRF